MVDGSFDVPPTVMNSIAARVAARFQAANDNTRIAERVAARMLEAESARYLPPEARGKDPIVPEGTDLAIWTWDSNNRFWGICFAGKQSKPLWYYAFGTEAKRQAEIDRTVAARKSVLKYKQDKLDERKNYKHDYKVGDILYSSWGYDQTNINFYQVVEVLGAMVSLREVAQKVVREDSSADYVVAVEGKFTGPVLKRKPGVGGSVKVTESQRASKWDGKPKYQTNAYSGH